MKLFTINTNQKLIPYNEHHFKDYGQEKDLENLLEKNPEFFFENSDVLIIGRQVKTNLNSFIDLLGVDKNGNTIVVELKRGRTSRETIAQALEYASFIENLDYSQLNEIYQNYMEEESNLEDYHQNYFPNDVGEKVSFNKSCRLIIVAQNISKEVRQTALFLRKKGINISCMEFKYFETKSGEKIISSDYVVNDDDFIDNEIQSASLPKVNEKDFENSLDKNGQRIFQHILEFAKQKELTFRWGSKGFSLNVKLNNDYIALFLGYPPDSVFKQCIYTKLEIIERKVNNSDKIIEYYKNGLENLGFFQSAKSNFKWEIDKEYSQNEVKKFFEIIDNVILMIRKNEKIS